MASTTLQRRHFEFLAEAFGQCRTRVAQTSNDECAIDDFIDAVAERLKETNPSFDAKRFDDAVIDNM